MAMTAITTAEERIIRAKVQLRRRYPFFSYLAVYLEPKKTDPQDLAGGTRTMGVDIYGNLYYLESWVNKLTEEELMAVNCHEVLHPTLNHFARQGVRDDHIWGVSCDLSINSMLVEEGLGKELPKSPCIPDDSHCCTLEDWDVTICEINRKATEEVYDEIISQLRQNGRLPAATASDGSQDGGWEIHIWSDKQDPRNHGKDKKDGEGSGEGDGESDEDPGTTYQQKLEGLGREWRNRMLDAQTNCEMTRGHVPAGIRMEIERVLDPEIPWYIYIEQFIERNIITDFTYRRPRKTFYDNDIYLPSVIRENLELVYHMDSSGSMGKDDKEKAVSELYYLLNAWPNVKAWVLVCDADIHDVFELSSQDAEDIADKIEIHGGGGTSHKPVVEWVNENVPGVQVLVSFTDGESDIQQCYDDLPASCSRLIVLTGHRKEKKKQLESFGDVIETSNKGGY